MSDSFNMKNIPNTNPEFKDLYLFHGKSAYQAAVEYGFEGTEEEWVEAMTALVFGTMESFGKKNPRMIYIDLNTDNIYRYDKDLDKYIPIGGVLGETEDTAYRGDRGKIAYDHSQSEHVALDHKHTASDITDFEDQRLNIKVVDIMSATDLNTVIEPNMYRGDYVSDITNAPIEGSTRFKLEVYDGGSDTRIQVYMGEDNLSYYRVIQIENGEYKDTLLDWRLSGALYEHPDTHPATMIVEDANRRFVSDTEKETWNSAEKNAKDYTDSVIRNLSGSAPEGLNSFDKISAALGDDPNFAENVNKSIEESLSAAKEYADKQLTDLLGNAPELLNTLDELAKALGNDPNFATTITEELSKKANSTQVALDIEAALEAAKSYSDKNLATAKTYTDSSATTLTENFNNLLKDYLSLTNGGAISGRTEFITNDGKPLIISRLGSGSEKTEIYQNDIGLWFNVLNDEAMSYVLFNFKNTDDEQNGGADANENTITFYSDKSGTRILSTYFTGDLTGNADTATKATQDSAGQQINTTYIKGLSITNNIITYTKGDGTTDTMTLPSATYTLPVAGTALGGIKSGGSITVGSDGTVTVKDDSHRHTLMTVADLRDAAFAPSDMHTKSLATFFRNTDMPSSAWWSGITVAGWSTDYNQWQLAGYSHNDDANKSLYYRNGRSSTWQAWREILDSSNYGNYALPLAGGKKITGSVSFGDIKLYPETNSTGSLGDASHVWYNMFATNATINNITATNVTANTLIKSTGPIFGYRYKSNANAPAFVFDKPGSNFTGIGANGTTDTIFFGAVNTTDYTWVTSYKQKWVFNGSVSADNFSNNNDTPHTITTGLNFVNKALAWNAGSYLENVILLLPVLTASNQSCKNYVDGKFLCWKTGGNVYDVVHVNINCVYNTLYYYIDYYGNHSNWKLCRCTYNGIQYYALKCPYHANPYTNVEFVGHIRSDLAGGTNTSTKQTALPLGVAYYDQYNAKALNTEVYNSISDTLTTTYVTGVGVCSLHSVGGFGGYTLKAAAGRGVSTSPTSGSTDLITSGAVYTIYNELKNSVSNGKTLVANAITAKGVSTATTATFETMATNIGKLGGFAYPVAITSFSASGYASSPNVKLSWTLPTDSARCGIRIMYSTSSAPTSASSGTLVYDSNSYTGTTTTSCTFTTPAANTTYYLTIFTYTYVNNTRYYTTGKSISFKSVAQLFYKFTSSGTFTVPSGVTKIRVWIVNGGYSGSSGNNNYYTYTTYYYGGAGGRGGNYKDVTLNVTPGTQYTVTIGAAGNGNTSKFGSYTGDTAGASGASGNYIYLGYGERTPHTGSAAGNGVYAFNDATWSATYDSSIRYCAGGGCGAVQYSYNGTTSVAALLGGTTGGGAGGVYNGNGSAATANTGSGGGGGGNNHSTCYSGGNGGSGCVIIRVVS